MSVCWSVTHKQMTVLYTTDRYPAGRAAESEMVRVLEQRWGENLCMCVRERDRVKTMIKTKTCGV